MKKITYIQIQQMRSKRNKDLINRMNSGETLSNYSNTNSWFPNRPIIEKDGEAIDKLYKENEKSKISASKKGSGPRTSSLKLV